jgi:hypothetical protein
MKEVIERGRCLRLAIPLPDNWDPKSDPLALARSVIGRLNPTWVRTAQVVELPVRTPLVPSGDGLTRIMGQIADHDTDRESTFVHRVICLVAEIASSDAARHDAQIQWPAAVVVDGVRYPEDE